MQLVLDKVFSKVLFCFVLVTSHLHVQVACTGKGADYMAQKTRPVSVWGRGL